jgi:hypothetical protein
LLLTTAVAALLFGCSSPEICAQDATGDIRTLDSTTTILAVPDISDTYSPDHKSVVLGSLLPLRFLVVERGGVRSIVPLWYVEALLRIGESAPAAASAETDYDFERALVSGITTSHFLLQTSPTKDGPVYQLGSLPSRLDDPAWALVPAGFRVPRPTEIPPFLKME